MKLNEVKSQPITEKVLGKIGVSKVNKGDIPATLAYVSKLSGIPQEDFTVLGSVGKTPQSGDIDIALDASKYDSSIIHTHMEKLLPDGHSNFSPGLKVGSYAIPIAGNSDNGFVQTDLMFVSSPRWAEFAYHSPAKDSQYKGAVRTVLLMSVAAFHSEPGIDQFIYEDGDLVVVVGRTFDLNNGLRRLFQHKPAKKRGTGRVARLKTVKDLNELKDLYPGIEVHGNEIVIDDPQQVLNVLFGDGVSPGDVTSAEDVLALIKRTFDKGHQDEIFAKAKQRLASKAAEWDLPSELK